MIMTHEWFSVIVLLGAVVLLALPLGRYMAKVYTGEPTWLSRLLRPLETALYRLCRVDEKQEMSWKTYTMAFLWFNAIGLAALFLLQMIQGWLPLNPEKLGAVRWDTALNTAISFVTNTNWQAYSGEQTMSYLTQMLGLTVQNFVSAAAGMAPGVAMIRGFSRQTAESIGNFWVDLTRSVLYILLPLAVLVALLLVSQGTVQTLRGYVHAETLEGKPQVIAVGPAASQIAIKQLGTNGGGFFNANSAHPFENPTPLTNFLEMLSIIVIAVAFAFMLGHMVKDRRVGWAFFSAMAILFLIGLAVVLWAECHGNPLLAQAGVHGGANMEGKEARFGITQSALWAQITTVTSNGSVNAMHDSMMPLTGLILLFNMSIGEVIFGGVGVGLIGILFHAIIAMFLAGLMIGRTPELLGKKLEPWEMVMAVIAVVAPGGVLLALAAVAVVTPAGLSSVANPGPHGLSEILYAFASPLGNNGSAFAGLNANTVFYNLMTGFGMLVERFATILPALAIAGFLARKRAVPQTAAMFPTASWIFVVMLVSVVIVFGALTFFPAFVLGPFLEHRMILAGRTF